MEALGSVGTHPSHTVRQDGSLGNQGSQQDLLQAAGLHSQFSINHQDTLQ